MPAWKATTVAAAPLTLVVPCFNEAARLYPEAFAAALRRCPSLTLLFVDDGSEDETSNVLSRIAMLEEGRVLVLRLPQNLGKAEAVRQGVRAAFNGAPALVGYWDADLATPMEAVEDFLALLDHRPDVDLVMGSRVLLLGRGIHRHPTRHYLGRFFATAASLALGCPVYDTQCGAKIFRVNDRTKAIFDRPFTSRWSFDVELIARYLATDAVASDRIYELALRTWRDVAGSKVRTRDMPRALADVIRVYVLRRAHRLIPAVGVNLTASGTVSDLAQSDAASPRRAA